MTSTRSALIVGAGIAGPACALALAKIGIHSTIVESHPGPSDGVGAIITIADNGFDILRSLGVAVAVSTEAQVTSEIQMLDAAGHTFARYPGGGSVIARDTLARILAERAQQGGTLIHYDRRLVGVQATSHGVRAHFSDGDDLEADMLVGADGIHSTVRDLIDSNAPRPAYEGVLGFGAATHAPAVHAELGVMNFAFGQRFLGYWRLPDGRIAWYAALPHADELTWHQVSDTPRSEWLARLRAAYVGHTPAADLLSLTAPGDLITTGPMLRMPSLPHWYSERLVLVGDSAHAPSSTSGQGASLALESALDLARCLRDTPDLDTAFATYEHLRRPRVQTIAENAAAANRNKAGKPSGEPVSRFDPTDYRIEFDRPVVSSAGRN
ncbi:MAG: FAD-dependent oxidoreductase [Humibacter sp.]